MLTAIRKHSKKRDAILAAIRSTTAHPSAQWVYDQVRESVPDLSLGTVYRNMRQFQQDKLVVSLGVVNGEERFDGDVAPHPHLICEHCGHVYDLPAHFHDGARLGYAVHADGHRIDPCKTVYYGACRHCAATTPHA